MTTAVIEIENLRKTFRALIRPDRVALDGFDMVVERGQIHGFLGPNGSGKTTTLRTLLGLVRPDGGRMSVLGAPAPRDLPAVAPRFGAIVESPQFFGNFTGRRTLRLLATAGGVPASRVEEVLTQVGLRDRGDQRVKAYSLGMKQRLAVASALLKRPELLILDEPANGLDPAGIREMRDMMRGVRDAGVTVLVSSHILAEIEQVCDSVTIISRGRRVLAGPVSEVLSRFDSGRFRVRTRDLAAAAAVLTEALGGSGQRVEAEPDHLVVAGVPDAALISEALGRRDIWITELTPLAPDLESVFLALTGTTPTPERPHQVDDSVQPPPAAPAPVDLGTTATTSGAPA